MRNPIARLLLLLSLALSGPLAAQTPLPPLAMPATLDVAGLHLVLTDEAQRLVQQKADGLRRHQPSFQARVDLADAAFPIIDRVLREEGVPLDFHYLVLQESALIGDAQSAHQAVGYWQLKRETATGLGLLVNDAVDERQHLAASTRAAARYLARNNASLRNWLNALLSYNTGLTGVQPFTLPTDVDASEMAITGATSPYVLMFLAHKLAFEPACGLNPRPLLRLQEFPAVAGQPLASQAQTLHVEPSTLAVHNRWLLAPLVPADKPYTLIVPIGDITQAAGIVANQRLQSTRELLALPEVSAADAAEVRLNDLRALIALPGETVMDLARRGGGKLGNFLRDNELTAFDGAIAGRPYYLESKRDAAAVEYHVVQPGETVFDVAQKYGIRKKAIFAKNRLARNEELRPGRLLWLQHVRPREVAVEYRTLPEGVALERADASREVDTTSSPAPLAVGAAATDAEAHDGWGEALPAVAAGAGAVAPSPRPAIAAGPVRASAPRIVYSPSVPTAAAVAAAASGSAPAPAVAQLPPPAAPPAPAPLADEPDPRRVLPPAAATEPVAARPLVVPAPRPAPVMPPARPAASPAVASRVAGAAAPKTAPVAAAAASADSHRVEPGETVYSISRRYQIAPALLMAWNELTPPAGLAVGQVLVLKSPAPGGAVVVPPVALELDRPVVRPGAAARYAPGTTAAAAAPPVGGALPPHTVAKGETLYSIAKRYEVSVADLQTWNSKPDQNVRIGEVLRVQVVK